MSKGKNMANKKNNDLRLDQEILLAKLDSFKSKKILVIGDIGLDEYILGEVRRISPEAPVPVVEVEKVDFRLGMAANVALNIQSLGANPVLVSVVGQDSGAESIKEIFKKLGLNSQHLIVDPDRPTTRKARVMAKHHHVVRVDYETRKFISEKTENLLLKKINGLVGSCDAIIIEDYAKGSVTQNLIKKINEIAKKFKKEVYVDPNRANAASFYKGVSLIKPNFDEAIALSGLNYDEMRDHPNKVIEVGKAVQQKTGAKQVVLTRGKDGMTLFSGRQVLHVPTYARQVFDVTGAGDTVIATLTLGLVSGLNLEQASQLANYAAGVVVGQVGCVPCTVSELKDYIRTSR
jgi:rfaE bifunctional protein kinase chain/domain